MPGAAGMGPRGQYSDYIVHPERRMKQLKALGLMDAEGNIINTPKDPGHRPEVRLPMGRDHVSGKKAAEIAARQKAREERMALDVTLEFTEAKRKLQLEARKTLKETKELDPGERARLEALTKAELSDLVKSEAALIQKEIRARLQNTGPTPVEAVQ